MHKITNKISPSPNQLPVSKSIRSTQDSSDMPIIKQQRFRERSKSVVPQSPDIVNHLMKTQLKYTNHSLNVVTFHNENESIFIYKVDF